MYDDEEDAEEDEEEEDEEDEEGEELVLFMLVASLSPVFVFRCMGRA